MLIFFSLLDVLTTYLGGIENEVNPLVRELVTISGFSTFLIAKLALAIYLLFIKAAIRLASPKLARIYNFILYAIYGGAVVWNLLYLLLHTS